MSGSGAGEATLCGLLERAARFPQGVRFLDRDERETFVSYDALLERARGVAGGLEQLGLERGDRVAIVLQTGPEFYDAFFGALLAGGVPVPLYPPVRLGRLDEYHAATARMLYACGARVVLTSRRLRLLLGTATALAQPPLGCLALERLERAPPVPKPAAADDPALVQFSSGTTMDPKPVLLTHRQILANLRAVKELVLPLIPEGAGRFHAGVSWLPLYHDMGLIGAVFTALEHPGPLTLIPPEIFLARPALWLRAISRYRATLTGAPNFAYGLCLKRVRDEELDGVDLSSLELALNGAEPVTAGVLERFVERFSRYGLRESALTPVYGLSEAALAVTFSDVRRRFRAQRFDARALAEHGVAVATTAGQSIVSVGRPLPGFEIEIRGPRGAALPSGRLGRVFVRGPSLMSGYLGRPEATADVLRDGWLDSGDTGFLDEGELYLYGRAKDLIILRGQNHAPQWVEQTLDGLPGLRPGCSAAVGHLADEDDSEGLLVFIEREGPAVDADALARAAHQRILERSALAPKRVVVLEPGTLPRTSSGKIRRGEALSRWRAGTLLPPAPVNALRIAAAGLRSALALSRASRAARRTRDPAGRDD